MSDLNKAQQQEQQQQPQQRQKSGNIAKKNGGQDGKKQQKLPQQQHHKLITDEEKERRKAVFEAELAKAPTHGDDGTPLTRNQRKKWLTECKRKEKRLFQRDEKKKRRRVAREEYDEEKIEALAQGLEPPPRFTHGGDRKPKRKKARVYTPEELTSVRKYVIDCQFDELMTEKERVSLRTQIGYCYNSNKHAENDNPAHLVVSSFHGQLKDQVEASFPAYDRWHNLSFHSESYLDLYDKERLVYLTSDSSDVVAKLNPDDVYIIGGIVDHNRLKGLTYNKAKEQGLRTAQLPIGDFIQLAGRNVLTVNHVYDVLLNYDNNGGNWKKAFLDAVPSRKIDKEASADEKKQDDKDEGEAPQDPSQEVGDEGEGNAHEEKDLPSDDDHKR